MGRGLRAPRAALEVVLAKRDVRAAVKQARRLRSANGVLRFCWDLDNTLVDSGSLLHAGRRLDEAIVDAEPVSNMLALYEAMHGELPDAEHFILSARMRRMRPDTLSWLKRYGLSHAEATVCFVPYVQAKRNVWEELARHARLIIVDDLSYNHEAEQVSIHQDLVDVARRLALVYIGLNEITEIGRNPDAVGALVCKTVESVVAHTAS